MDSFQGTGVDGMIYFYLEAIKKGKYGDRVYRVFISNFRNEQGEMFNYYLRGLANFTLLPFVLYAFAVVVTTATYIPEYCKYYSSISRRTDTSFCCLFIFGTVYDVCKRPAWVLFS